ncbi:hypothetical protein PISMIDRAFT_11002 [Pisolithus microcarpus 441]|uniref:Uncharacterized protein n=1 Tax=Pisolithus microcarpus 441 TaxID=765257 RepID=A0A0C9Z2E5_9AGAM|nr:hypothetical protein BKA83DRAFT_11002 [Pisolithus microcarpus]KIK23216.1 hypothetical protein PISMIDRAFT_11002 [Pisolithus microcarpus 441]
MGATRTVTERDKQRAATERWLSKPGYKVYSVPRLILSLTPVFRVRDEQREKARLRAARKRTVSNEATTCNSTSTSADGASPDNEPESYLHPLAHSDLPPLEKVRQLIADWHSEWGAESTWPKKFHEELKHAQDRGRLTSEAFFSECEAHVEGGRRLLCLLRSIMRKGFRGTGYKVADSYEQVFDLLTSLLTELRFFEVKLDEFAPISPLSRISEARYYFTV